MKQILRKAAKPVLQKHTKAPHEAQNFYLQTQTWEQQWFTPCCCWRCSLSQRVQQKKIECRSTASTAQERREHSKTHTLFFKFLAFKNQPQPPCSRCYPPVERIQTRQLFQCIYLIINTDMLLKNSFCNAIYELCKAGSLQCWHKQPLTGQNTAMYHSHSSFSTPFFFLAPVFLC